LKLESRSDVNSYKHNEQLRDYFAEDLLVGGKNKLNIDEEGSFDLLHNSGASLGNMRGNESHEIEEVDVFRELINKRRRMVLQSLPPKKFTFGAKNGESNQDLSYVEKNRPNYQ